MVSNVCADGRNEISIWSRCGWSLSKCGGCDLALVSKKGTCPGAGICLGCKPVGRSTSAAAAGSSAEVSGMAGDLLGHGWDWSGLGCGLVALVPQYAGADGGNHGFGTYRDSCRRICRQRRARWRAMEKVVCAASALGGCDGLLLLCMGKLVLLRMVHDLAGTWSWVFGWTDGSVRFVSVCDGFAGKFGWRGVERAVGRAVWTTGHLSLGDGNLFVRDEWVAPGDEFCA